MFKIHRKINQSIHQSNTHSIHKRGNKINQSSNPKKERKRLSAQLIRLPRSLNSVIPRDLTSSKRLYLQSDKFVQFDERERINCQMLDETTATSWMRWEEPKKSLQNPTDFLSHHNPDNKSGWLRWSDQISYHSVAPANTMNHSSQSRSSTVIFVLWDLQSQRRRKTSQILISHYESATNIFPRQKNASKNLGCPMNSWVQNFKNNPQKTSVCLEKGEQNRKKTIETFSAPYAYAMR